MNAPIKTTPIWIRTTLVQATSLALLLAVAPLFASAAPPLSAPVVARVEMKLAEGEKVIDVIQKGDLLTVIEERENEWVIATHDGKQGAVDKVNAVRIEESGEIYTELIQRNPDQGRFYTLRASSWWALGKADKALEDYDRAIELGYEAPHAFISRGLFLASMGEYDKAIADYETAISLDPDDIAPLINRAAVYMMKGEYANAVADYTAALEQEPQRTNLMHQRAIALKASGQLEKAAEDFTSILAKNQQDRVALMGRGYVRFQQQDHAAAVEDFGKAIELNEKDPVAFNNRGYNRVKIGQFAEALEDYDQALQLAPKYALALQNRAWLLATVEDEDVCNPAEAVKSAKEACELTNYEAVNNLSALAAALAADGQFDEAIGWQEKVVEMIGEPYKGFAEKTLQRYQNERPFAADPDKANAREKAAAEAEAAAAKKLAASEETAAKAL